ncbi:MAG: alpha/beta fold hydrolase [Smithellaceae bacterium]
MPDRKNEMLALRKQDVGGAELPSLFFTGDAAAPQMVFLHATGFLPWLWQPVIEEFVPANNVWAPFICDYRSGNLETGGLSWDVIARDLSTFFRLQQIQEPLIVGHSMGATVAAIAAASYGLQPRGLILIEPIILPVHFYAIKPDIKTHPLASKSIKRTNYWKNEDDAWFYLKSKPLFADWDERILQIYLKYGMKKREEGSLQLTCSPQSETAIYLGGWDVNPWPLLSALTCPVLIVEGEMSTNRNLVDVQKAVSLLPRGKYQSVAGAGHFIPMQKPKEIAAIIKEFNMKIT